jgi:hypothetical protein
MYERSFRATVGTAVVLMCVSASAAAQTEHQHEHMNQASSGWQFMQDGVVFGLFNSQGGPSGGDEFVVPNWWMGMATRKMGKTDLTLNAMFSLDAATVGTHGYREIFQAGEAVDGQPLIDRQHPHDLFMQLAAVWRIPLSDRTGLTIAGGPSGEPALGPVAFMHRSSAAENPLAPLGHHKLDSSHIAFGVITAALDHGPWTVEGSVFNGREPDQHRWDFDFGKLDSVSARLWFKPTRAWELQVSTGHVVDPEELTPGNLQRTTASAAWQRRNGSDFTAVTAGYGVNAEHDTSRQSVFVEATRRSGLTSIFGRAEIVQLETDLWLQAAPHIDPGTADQTDAVAALTVGAVRDVLHWRGFEGGIGGDVTFYAVPDPLKPTHGQHPVSFQLFFRLRPPAGPMGRMWDRRMAQPMIGHGMAMNHE